MSNYGLNKNALNVAQEGKYDTDNEMNISNSNSNSNARSNSSQMNIENSDFGDHKEETFTSNRFRNGLNSNGIKNMEARNYSYGSQGEGGRRKSRRGRKSHGRRSRKSGGRRKKSVRRRRSHF